MEKAKIVVVGGGPAGIATAVEAKAAGIEPVIVLEKEERPCHTIQKYYHKGKRVDAVWQGQEVKPEGICRFETCTKEEFLELMEKYIKDYKIDLRTNQEVYKIEKTNDCFRVWAGKDTVIEAPIVVIAIGIFGKPVKPRYRIPKEVKDKVFFGTQTQCMLGAQKILVVGGGDSAAETACFLCDEAEIYLSYRRPQFFRINEQNLKELEKRVKAGKVKLLMNTDIESLSATPENKVKVRFKDGQEMVFDAVYYCLGGATPDNFLRAIGVEMEDNRPKVDEYFETNIPGLFLVGDLVFEKGSIMAAFNSAHQVVKGIKERYQERLERGC
ncbi:NAD(P)-binding domain-containing protein [Thermodesulfatator autotrophicus]|uniref:Oxidoreductase n=1 Tax=Thermodesulfatator autotrophicus TaxID=1795632 RepID=A0A177EAI2_9BACT|nr:NAD(P)-binding domain-containing protein [Thermodesulfatator autotrophicus]OAG28746.1 oxidoreductase [Thermodesulfatator autotrophicus]